MEDGGEGVVIIDRHNSSSTAFVCQKNYNLHLDAAPLRAAPRPDVMQQVISRMNVTKKKEGKKGRDEGDPSSCVNLYSRREASYNKIRLYLR